MRFAQVGHPRLRATLAAWLLTMAPAAPVATAGILIAAAPFVAEAQRAELEPIIRREVLDNGLEVIVVESHAIPLATVELDVKNGAFTQTPEYAGLAHLYEHMFFRANRSYPNPGQFMGRAGELGAAINGTTREEVVNYYMTVPADSLAPAIALMSTATLTPLFLEEEMRVERQVVLGEYDRAESSPFFDFENAMTRALYPGNFSRKNTIGDRDVVATATPAMMRTIQDIYYVPNNSALIVTGDVNPDQVIALARQHFGGWKRGANPFETHPIPPIPPVSGDTAIIVEAPVSSVSVMLQWQGPSVGKDPEATYTADVFSDVLNNPGSRFQQRLVDSGLWQSVGVNYYTLNNVGPITILGQVAPERLKEALAALEREIAQFHDPEYISEEELRYAKASRAVSSAYGNERVTGLTHTIGFWWSVADLEYFLGYVDSMADQERADLRRYADTYIVGKPRVTGVLLSPQTRQRLALKASDLLPSAMDGAQ